LEPLPVEVFTHSSTPPNPWAGYRLCLQRIPDCSHLLIVQDDTAPVPNFVPALHKIAERNVDTPVCLFLASNPRGAMARARRAMSRDQRYVALYPSPFVPIVAVLWPREKAIQFLEWTESGVTLPGHPTPRADDSVLAAWSKKNREPFIVACPSLVEHLDVPSVKGVRNAASAWKAVFLAEDADQYEW
jgi:hypothetical protein